MPDNEQYLFLIESGYVDDEPVYVLAKDIREAMVKYKKQVAAYIQEDYDAEGIEKTATSSEVEDPTGVNLVASPYQLIL